MPVRTFEDEETGFSLEELQEWKTQLETIVREHPIVSAGIAVGAGVLIARLLKDAFDDDSGGWRRRRKKRGGLFASEIGKALMGSLATMAAAKLQEALIEHVQEEAEPEPEPVRRRPRKQGRQRQTSQTRRRKVEE